MKKNWNLRTIATQPESAPSLSQIEPLINQILISRGLDDDQKINDFLNPDFDLQLHDPFDLSQMELAVNRLIQARNNHEKICIYGDYDADGVTSSALLKDFFNQLGLESFCYIPDRHKEGYGVNTKALDYISDQKTDLIITVDCGVSNVNELQYAKNLGLEVIILDHHHVPKDIPLVVAIINPKKPGDLYPEKELAGVGVAFKFAQACSQRIKDYKPDQIKWLLDLVAIGTIADCVPLLGENRLLAKYGLRVLAKTRRSGLKQLFQVARINISENHLPTSYQVSFQIAPRINAAGRMDHANTAYQLLTLGEKEIVEARNLALELEAQNQKRQKVTEFIIKQVEKRIQEKSSLPKIIIESDPHWELGVIGLAAGKITDTYQRPSILLQQQDDICRGSGRSIKSFDMIQALERHKELFTQYGGHKQAAGMTLKNENFQELVTQLNRETDHLLEDEMIKQVNIDLKLKFNQITHKLLRELQLLEPYGQENWQPVFIATDIKIIDQKLIGNGEKHLKFRLQDPTDEKKQIFDAIGFQLAEKNKDLKPTDRINIVFNLELDTWNGNERIQLKLIDLEKKQ